MNSVNLSVACRLVVASQNNFIIITIIMLANLFWLLQVGWRDEVCNYIICKSLDDNFLKSPPTLSITIFKETEWRQI
jgi:hypothetical protein